MARFAHLSDAHLGGWKQLELQNLNFESFKQAVDKCLDSNLEFVLISGDLFDSAYPPIEILKKTFAQFKRLKDANLPCFIIAGSHDYSVSGKTFLDVLEKAGFCKNVYDSEEREGIIMLNPTIFKGVAIYGYPGKKSSMEIADLRKIKLQDAPGMFKIFMLHTTIEEAKGTIPVDSIGSEELPKADYYALGHLHLRFKYKNFIYPGPVFPNNFQELEDLKEGSFCIVDTDNENPIEEVMLKTKDVLKISISVTDAQKATEQIIKKLNESELEDKILLLRVSGELDNGTISDIKFSQIEEYAKHQGIYFMLRNTHNLTTKELDLDVDVKNPENIEGETIKQYIEQNESPLNDMIGQLMEVLSIEKQEGETVEGFKARLIDDTKKVVNL